MEVGRGAICSLSAQLPLPWGLVDVTPVTTGGMLWTLRPYFHSHMERSVRGLGLRLNLHLALAKVEYFISKLQCVCSLVGLLGDSSTLEAPKTSWHTQGQLPVTVACTQRDPELDSRVHCCCLEIVYNF